MSEVRKLDSQRRVVFPDLYAPGDVFIEEEVTADRVVFRRIGESEDVPLVPVVRRNGRLVVDRKVDRETIRRAIREERDAR